MTMLERAARAAFESHAWGDVGPDEAPHTWGNLPEEWCEVYRKAARAVLMAVREPSDSLSAAVRSTEGWEAIIDAILSEGAQ